MTQGTEQTARYSQVEGHIADLIACKKELIGIASWEEEVSRSSKRILKATLQTETDTEFRLVLSMDVDIRSSYQRGSLVLACNNIPIERMEHRNRKPHLNPLHSWVPKDLRGLEIPADIPRYYSWKNNRRLGWPEASQQNLKVCATIEQRLENYMDSVKYFLDATNIVFTVPPLEFDARLDL